MSYMSSRERESLDRYITGNYGEDQFRDYEPDGYEEEMTPEQDAMYHAQIAAEEAAAEEAYEKYLNSLPADTVFDLPF